MDGYAVRAADVEAAGDDRPVLLAVLGGATGRRHDRAAGNGQHLLPHPDRRPRSRPAPIASCPTN